MRKGSATAIEVIGAVLLVVIIVFILAYASKNVVFNVVNKVKNEELQVTTSSYNSDEKINNDDSFNSLLPYSNAQRVNKITDILGNTNEGKYYIQRKKCGYIIGDYCYMLESDELFSQTSQSSQQ